MAASPGTRVGPYEILALLGSGGMGEVYKATDTRLGRTVAIKFLKGEYTDRLDREARAIAALNHPHICTIHDVGPDYLVMEYLEGAPLGSPVPLENAIRLALQIAAALEAAHAKGIIHRDLKPGNIFVTQAGVKLLDFGLAKLNAEHDGSDDHDEHDAGGHRRRHGGVYVAGTGASQAAGCALRYFLVWTGVLRDAFGTAGLCRGYRDRHHGGDRARRAASAEGYARTGADYHALPAQGPRGSVPDHGRSPGGAGASLGESPPRSSRPSRCCRSPT